MGRRNRSDRLSLSSRTAGNPGRSAGGRRCRGTDPAKVLGGGPSGGVGHPGRFPRGSFLQGDIDDRHADLVRDSGVNAENPAGRQGFLIEMRFRPLSEGRFLPSSVASANRFNPRRLGGGLLGYRKNIAMALKVIQARRADMGIVKNQVKMIFPATSHFTSRNRLDAPTPKIPEVTTCVVLTGKPVTVALRMTEAEVRSAETPLAGSILKILELIVLMIFQPPKEVPSPIAAAAET